MRHKIVSAANGYTRRLYQPSKLQNTNMDQYKEFCRLRDYRKPGVEVPHHTEAEAFALAVQSKTGHAEPGQRKKNPTTKGIK